jgi:hypothetical protein
MATKTFPPVRLEELATRLGLSPEQLQLSLAAHGLEVELEVDALGRRFVDYRLAERLTAKITQEREKEETRRRAYDAALRAHQQKRAEVGRAPFAKAQQRQLDREFQQMRSWGGFFGLATGPPSAWQAGRRAMMAALEEWDRKHPLPAYEDFKA